MRENDYFLNAITNPTFTPSDFRSVGLNANNTSFESAETYEKLDFVKQNPIFQTDGKFDENKFKKYYKAAAEGYQLLSEQDFTTGLANSFSAFRNNILAQDENRIKGPEFRIEKKSALNPNPQRQKISAWGYNQFSEPINSDREIAESNKVWDVNTNKWIDSPNDQGFFKNLFDTKVLAQWEFDADIEGNKTNDPSQVVYKKGQYKLNYKGEPYYETLGNRSVYGRQVLSAFDTITTDNSSANKYDFFDSDDLDKSIGGTLVKNVIKVAPAFIPYIGPWYIAARVGLSSADLFAKMGKMAFGSENDTFSAIEGFSKAVTMSTSDYGQEHAWSIENLLNMGADVFTQLAEQRWLFQYFPSLLKGNKLGFSEKAQSAFREAEAANFISKQNSLQEALKAADQITDTETAFNLTANTLTRATSEANAKLAAILKNNYDIGKYVSRAYMTGITVADTYAEAKEAGASDLEAALITLGYAGAEWGILSTNLGEWFLPELRLEKQKIKQLIKGVTGIQPPKTAGKEIKNKWVKSLIDAGKKFFDGEYGYALNKSTVSATATHLFANAIGEGVEEVSEEVLQDFSKSLANAYYYMKDSDVSLKPTWVSEDGTVNLFNTLNDYALNFVGGFIGGGVGQMHDSYKEARKIKNLSENNSAFQELVYLIRQGKSDDIIKTANKMLLGDPNLSPNLNSDGVFETGTKESNQNRSAQTEFAQYVKNIEKIINLVGAKSQNDVLNDLTLQDISFERLLQSKVSASYLQDYNTLVSETIRLVEQLNTTLTDKKTDSDKLTESQEEEANTLRKKIAENQKLIQSYHDGTQAKEFLRDAMFEMDLYLSNGYLPTNIIQFIMLKEANSGQNRKLTEIPQNILEQYKSGWKTFSQSELKDQIRIRRKWFDKINERCSDFIKKFTQDYILAQNATDALSEYSESTLGLEGIQTGIIQQKNLSKALADYTLFLETKAKTPQQRDYLLTKILRGSISEDNKYEQLIDEVLNTDQPITTEIAEFLLTSDNQFIQQWKINTQSKTVNDILNLLNSENSASERNNLISYLIDAYKNEFLNSETDEIIKSLKETPFIKASIKQYLEDFIDRSTLPEESKNKIKETINKIKSTPFDKFLDEFQLILKDPGIKVSKLLQILETNLETALRSTKLTQFGYNEDLGEAIHNAINLISIVQSHLAAARTDNANYSSPKGYNVSVNKLIDDSDLATIDINQYNLLSEDLAKTQTELLFYQQLYYLNSRKSVEKDSKNHAKIVTSFFNKAKQSFTVNIPDNWKGKQELLRVFDELSHGILTDLTDNPRDLSELDDKIELQKAEVQMAEALFKFFQQNEEKDLSEIFTYDSFSDAISINHGDTIYRENDNYPITTRQFMYYLAAVATLQYSSFLNQYQQILDDQYYPFAGQLNLLYHEQAFSKSTFWFDKFNDLYNSFVDHAIQDDTINKQLRENLPQDWFFVKDSKKDNHLSISFDRVFLAEGCPGSGKSTANFAYFLKLNKARFTKPIFIVAKTVEAANRMIDTLSKITGIDKSNFIGFDKNKYLSYINSDYIAPTTINGTEVYKEDDEAHFPQKNTEDGAYHFPYESNFNTNIVFPSVVLIDEVTNFGQQQLFMHNAFMHAQKIVSLATGDFKQSTVKGSLSSTNVVYTSRNNFPSTARVAPSVRSNNLINSEAISSIEVKNEEFINNALNAISGNSEGLIDEGTLELQSENPFKIDYDNIKYSEDENGFFGIKFCKNEGDISDEIKKTIDIMLSTLQDEETVSFVFTKVNTPLYNYLDSLNGSGQYKGKIHFIQGSAQGEEGKYYIFDLDNQKDRITVNGFDDEGKLFYVVNAQDIVSYYKDFYTSISRAENGTLVILNGEFDEGEPYSVKVDSPGAFQISPEVKRQANKEMKEIIAKSIEGIELIEPNLQQEQEPQQQQNGEKGNKESSSGDMDNNAKYLQDHADDIKSILTIRNDQPRKTIAPLYSFNTLEIGASFKMNENEYEFYMDTEILSQIKEELKKDIKDRDFSNTRIDGVNGLAMIFGINKPAGEDFSVQVDEETGKIKNVQEILQRIKQIRFAFKYGIRDVQTGKETSLYTAVKRRLPASLGRILGDFKVKYQFKSYIEPTEDKQKKDSSPRFKKNHDEVIVDLIGKVENEQKITPRNKNIVATLSFNGQDVFETPIFAFPNYISLLQSFDKNLPTMKKKESASSYLSRLLNEYNEEKEKSENQQDQMKLTSLWSVIRLIEIFMLGSPNGVPKPIDIKQENIIDIAVEGDNELEKNQTILTNLKLTGPIIVNKDKGTGYEFTDEYIYLNATDTISHIFNSLSSFRTTKQAYTFIDGLEIGGQMIIEPGHAFILITEDPDDTVNDDVLLQKFIEQELHRTEDDSFYGIKIGYINSPIESVETYFKALHNRINSKNKSDKSEEIKQLLNDSNDKEVDQLDESNKGYDYLGNNVTNLRILQHIFKVDGIIEKIVSHIPDNQRNDARKNLNALKYLVDFLTQYEEKLTNSSSNSKKGIIDILNASIQDLVKANINYFFDKDSNEKYTIAKDKNLTAIRNVGGSYKPLVSMGMQKSLGSLLSRNLWKLICNGGLNFNVSDKIESEKIQEDIAKLLNDDRWKGISYHIPLKKDSEKNIRINGISYKIVPLNIDSDWKFSLTVGEKKNISMTAKIDQTMAIGDINQMLLIISKGIREKSSTQKKEKINIIKKTPLKEGKNIKTAFDNLNNDNDEIASQQEDVFQNLKINELYKVIENINGDTTGLTDSDKKSFIQICKYYIVEKIKEKEDFKFDNDDANVKKDYDEVNDLIYLAYEDNYLLIDFKNKKYATSSEKILKIIEQYKEPKSNLFNTIIEKHGQKEIIAEEKLTDKQIREKIGEILRNGYSSKLLENGEVDLQDMLLSISNGENMYNTFVIDELNTKIEDQQAKKLVELINKLEEC